MGMYVEARRFLQPNPPSLIVAMCDLCLLGAEGGGAARNRPSVHRGVLIWKFLRFQVV